MDDELKALYNQMNQQQQYGSLQSILGNGLSAFGAAHAQRNAPPPLPQPNLVLLLLEDV